MTRVAPSPTFPARGREILAGLLLALGLLAGCAPSSAHPAPPTPSSPPSVFATAGEAADYGARKLARLHEVRYGGADGCYTNESCLAFRDETDGSAAAYFRYAAYYRSDASYGCLVYVYRDGSGWHFLNASCGLVPERGSEQGVNATSGCADVRNAPGSQGKVVGCLQDGTPVYIDGGPTFVDDPPAPASTSRVWWHLKGQGWMAHEFLSPGFAAGAAQ